MNSFKYGLPNSIGLQRAAIVLSIVLTLVFSSVESVDASTVYVVAAKVPAKSKGTRSGKASKKGVTTKNKRKGTRSAKQKTNAVRKQMNLSTVTLKKFPTGMGAHKPYKPRSPKSNMDLFKRASQGPRVMTGKARNQVLAAARNGKQYNCSYCKNNFSKSKVAVDHVHPYAKGGPTTFSNSTTSCRGCNSAKSDKVLRP